MCIFDRLYVRTLLCIVCTQFSTACRVRARNKWLFGDWHVAYVYFWETYGGFPIGYDAMIQQNPSNRTCIHTFGQLETALTETATVA